MSLNALTLKGRPGEESLNDIVLRFGLSYVRIRIITERPSAFIVCDNVCVRACVCDSVCGSVCESVCDSVFGHACDIVAYMTVQHEEGRIDQRHSRRSISTNSGAPCQMFPLINM